ncbi:MAG: sugar phosphate isomerase/epimerase [Candidatus Hydrogenedentes bacterium]|nr:sugar phosphate isomerase/epimerase [Candidatus Hydrogenedentota bacterium]
MLPGINQWAFPAGMATADAIALAKRIGFSAFEVCLGDKGPTALDITERDAAALRAYAEKQGITLYSVASGMGWDYHLTSNDAKNREQAMEVTRRVLQVAAWLGAQAILVVPGVCDAATSYDAALENALEAFRELADTAEKLKVSIGVENVWNKFLLSPVEMRDFIDQCESEYIGAYFDTGNIMQYGFPEQWIRILGDRIRAGHLKDFRRSTGTLDGFVMLMEGDVNWPEVMAAFREIDYRGALTAEYMPAYQHSLDTMLGHLLASEKAILAL